MKWYTIVFDWEDQAAPIVVRYLSPKDIGEELRESLSNYLESEFPDTDEVAVRDVMDEAHVTYEICGNVRKIMV